MFSEDGCEVCFLPPEGCVCPECPTCGVQGDPKCYAQNGHLRLSREQAISRQEFRVLDAQDKLSDEYEYLQMLQDGVDFEDTL